MKPITKELSPMLQQYLSIKEQLPERTMLLIKLGDFYEILFDDALTAARIMGVALTKRGSAPMAGIPCHAAETYTSKLLTEGWKVAVFDPFD